MPRFPCPACRSELSIESVFHGRVAVNCPVCGLEEMLERTGSTDEAYLEFLIRFDRGQLPRREGTSSGGKQDALVRDRAEVEKMVGDSKPDAITQRVLHSQKDYISYYTKIKSSPPAPGPYVHELGLDDALADSLAAFGVSRLHRFQEEALVEIADGGNAVIESPTASGKTEAFLVPIIQGIRDRRGENRAVVALFVYPTKSLARDQLQKIKKYANAVNVDAEVFDGDTDYAMRRRILEDPPQILITNFDTIHYHLWHRTRLAPILASARFLVADEVHTYSGIFGSNVHYIIKRLKRLAKGIQLIAASATLDNAERFCGQLFGARMRHIRGSASKGEIEFVMAFPSKRDRISLMAEMAKDLTAADHKTMLFSNSHRLAELLAILLRGRGIDIQVHRAGLSTSYRRHVESAFRDGRLRAISCTPTLELGMDVGDVDGVISSTVPVNRLMQRIGRAARKGQRGYAFLALGNDPISQYYRNHPEDYFADVEGLHIDPQNPFIEEAQVLAMACDKPLAEAEAAEHLDVVHNHLSKGLLRKVGARYVPEYAAAKRLLDKHNIRGTGGSVSIMLYGKRVGDRALPIALEELHPGAIYLLAGTKYRVKEFGYPREGHAELERIPREYPCYTRALTREWPAIDEILERRYAFGTEVAFCRLRIRKSVYGYVETALWQEAEAQPQRQVTLTSPLEHDLVTKGIAFHAPAPSDAAATSDRADVTAAGGYHAAEHVIIEGSNMITGGASRDLGGISMFPSGMIFVYDGAIGGSGASRALYERLEKALERSALIAGECPCLHESGCPRCTFSYRCGNNNDFLHKAAALEVLQRIVSGEKTRLGEPQQADQTLV